VRIFLRNVYGGTMHTFPDQEQSGHSALFIGFVPLARTRTKLSENLSIVVAVSTLR
jgi:hypothetical protein